MLHFEKVQLLSYQHTPQLFEAGLKFRIQKKLTINGYLLDANKAVDGVTSLLNKERAVIDAAKDYDDIYLEGVFFGNGKIESIEFNGGTLARSETYTYNIVCYQDGDLSNAGSEYTGISWTNSRLWENLSEELSFEEDENGDSSYTHSIALRVAEQTTAATAITLAKAVAAIFLNATSGLGAFLGNYANTVKKLYTESYDVVEGSISISETAFISKENQGNYSSSLAYEINLDEQGFVSIQERVTLIGNTRPRMAGAEEGFAALKGASYTRANNIYTAYNFSDATLYDRSLESTVTRNEFAGTIEFTTLYSNDPKYNDYAIWNYSLNYSRNPEGVATVSEDGDIIGMGRPFLDKYQNANSFYATVKAGVDARLLALYTSQGGTGTLHLIETGFSRDEFQGSIAYSFVKTDDNLYNVSAPFKKIEVQTVLSNPVHLIQKYDIFNFEQIVQTQKQSTLGQKSISINIKGQRGTPITTYLTEAKSRTLALAPPNTDTFLADCQYEFSPQTNDFTFNAEYNFPGSYKSLNELALT